MKLLFDENLSPKLPNRLSDLFPNSLHVRDVGMKATIDPIVWNYEKDNDLMIVSKDADMHARSLVFGNPPKVIWIRLGNDAPMGLNLFNNRRKNTRERCITTPMRVESQLVMGEVIYGR